MLFRHAVTLSTATESSKAWSFKMALYVSTSLNNILLHID
jgi:hypothetical protein